MRAAHEPRRVAEPWNQARHVPEASDAVFFCVRLSVFGNRLRVFGVGHLPDSGAKSSVAAPASSAPGGVSGIRFRALAQDSAFPPLEQPSRNRNGDPSGESGGVFPSARTQEGPPVREGLGAARAAVFPCANRGSGSFRERVEENQCIMEGSHKLSCGKATMSPTHTNRPTT